MKDVISHLIQTPLDELKRKAFRVRKAGFGKEITFAIPGTVSYDAGNFPSQKDRFAAVSITGRECDLRCAHCKGTLLESMIPAPDPETFLQVVDRLRSRGATGILVSGGADKKGEVPLRRFVHVIGAVKRAAPLFKVICHTGLIRRETAIQLREAGVDQVLIDVIGDDETIRQIYHLDRRTQDYEETLWMLKEMGHPLAPHIIIGHHFGEIRGEWKALEMITRVGVETIVLVIIKTLHASGPDPIRIPEVEEASRISAVARLLNPATPIRMGCIRPAHPRKAVMEREFIDSGINTIAHPLQGTIDYAREKGLETKFVEMCCSLI